MWRAFEARGDLPMGLGIEEGDLSRERVMMGREEIEEVQAVTLVEDGDGDWFEAVGDLGSGSEVEKVMVGGAARFAEGGVEVRARGGGGVLGGGGWR